MESSYRLTIAQYLKLPSFLTGSNALLELLDTLPMSWKQIYVDMFQTKYVEALLNQTGDAHE